MSKRTETSQDQPTVDTMVCVVPAEVAVEISVGADRVRRTVSAGDHTVPVDDPVFEHLLRIKAAYVDGEQPAAEKPVSEPAKTEE